ncbi:TraR/DksA C4-type zinc finger protein [Blattabacterium sp. (Cryptocercus punctulatus) str. Cpu]|uniref:TraR/DksA family transcriptional regulator n=1 Tax=Blattabacterium sp. (Cryptocercus punctulatus) str. Cpu TaxID=1075399 RepID=UPI0002387286|nr:TraR/DksA C4-type zinc finger protein [Blattabacterium sp. (Cryptocercus punctulatus) str. Cpu]AEU09217.1 DnaK suppressor protein [Blattabacterium sp. (Cryptocercus punctulatus) str. Cpu]
MKEPDKQRYSMEERKEFRKLILKKLEKVKKDLSILKDNFDNDQNNGTDDTYPTFKAFEEGSETLSKEQNAQILEHLKKFIQSLNSALIRVENKDYGICRITKKLIPKARLMAVPHTTLSIEGKRQVENQKK